MVQLNDGTPPRVPVNPGIYPPAPARYPAAQPAPQPSGVHVQASVPVPVYNSPRGPLTVQVQGPLLAFLLIVGTLCGVASIIFIYATFRVWLALAQLSDQLHQLGNAWGN